MNWEKVKGFVLGGGALMVFGLLMGFVNWRIGVLVDEAIAAQDLGTDTKIISMDTNIATNEFGIAENKEDNEATEQRLQDVAAVLMRPPGNNND